MSEGEDAEHTGVASATPSDDAPSGTDGAAEIEDNSPALYGCPVVETGSQQVLFPHRDQWLEVATALLADGWNMCLDVTAVDYLTHPGRSLPAGVDPERFEVVASFVSHTRRARLRARVQVPIDDPTIDSLTTLYPGTDFLEREVYDLMGITFTGHPDLSRILMPESWEGHPLRKDFATGTIPVQFKAPQQSEVAP
jgi:NADH-quinone oxidoreductase subunit C